MILDVLSNLADDRRHLIIGAINMADAMSWEVQSGDEDDYWVDSANLINRFYGNELGDEIVGLDATHTSLIKKYEYNDDWHQIASNYLRLEYVKMFEANNIDYVAIKNINDDDCYDIFVKHKNSFKLFELLFRDPYTFNKIKMVDDVLTTANWFSFDSPITNDDVQNYENHMSEYGKQYMDWLAEYNINYYETYPLRIAPQFDAPKIYFKYEDHIELFKSMLVEIKMLYG